MMQFGWRACAVLCTATGGLQVDKRRTNPTGRLVEVGSASKRAALTRGAPAEDAAEEDEEENDDDDDDDDIVDDERMMALDAQLSVVFHERRKERNRAAGADRGEILAWSARLPRASMPDGPCATHNGSAATAA